MAPRRGPEVDTTFVAVDEKSVGTDLWGGGKEGEEEGGKEKEGG